HNPLEPLVTAVVFFLAILTAVVVLYVVDRSLERRSEGLLTALEDAVRGDPFIVLRREVQELERASSLVNGMLAYCVGLLAEALVFVILLRNGIDDATTLAVMRQGFLLPVVPAALFGLVYFFAARGIHRERLRVVEERLGRMRPTNRPRRHPQ
ncbi:MAG TPA: hypothetical protein VI796_00605, partial [Candidatus Thermoplasmatota archaeon]|nr:hypothetical protein [Candidatus Thermoplasmatota archaeon]